MSMVVRAAGGLNGYSSFQHSGGKGNPGGDFGGYLKNSMNRQNAQAAYYQPSEYYENEERGGIKRILSDMKRERSHIMEGSNRPAPSNSLGNSVINASQKYLDTIRAGRERAKKTDLSMKRLKYNFKSISSKILRAKTSATARQVVSQAKREIIRLKKLRLNDGASEELEAAIAHAKAMERIARKKMRHLQEEEMAKASGGLCADREIELEEQEAKESEESAKEKSDSGVGRRDYWEEFEDEELGNLEELEAEMLEHGGFPYDMTSVEQLTYEFLGEMTDEMNEMMEDLGLEELNDSLMAVKGDMDPADYKEMVIKHRNKEMKDIVKADGEYLKVVFHNHSASLGAVEGSNVASVNITIG